MFHYFDSDIAKRYGMLEAVLFQNISYWVEKNRANGKHIYDGRAWTYNSAKAFSEMFPYASPQIIRRALLKLEKEGLILTGNYNGSRYDQTKWYAVSDFGNSILQNQQIDFSKMKNGIFTGEKPIPDNKPNNKQQIINTDIYSAVPAEHSPNRFVKPTYEEVKAYCDERHNGIDPQYFIDRNDAIGWVVGKNRTPMKDWKACIRTWERNRKGSKIATAADFSEFLKGDSK